MSVGQNEGLGHNLDFWGNPVWGQQRKKIKIRRKALWRAGM